LGEEGGVNLTGFVGNNSLNSIDTLGLIGGLSIPAPPVPEGELTRAAAFALIAYYGKVGEGLPQRLLRRWLWREGDYRLTSAEFGTDLWGPKAYRVNNAFDNPPTYRRINTLTMSSRFRSDLAAACGSGDGKGSFSGTYLIPDYALSGRTLGHFFWTVEASVKCACCSSGYEATGTVRVEDVWDFNAAYRENRKDEADVAKMRWFHRITGMGQDFGITTERYAVSESSKCNSNPLDLPYLKRQ
jgi:hypothetical protein